MCCGILAAVLLCCCQFVDRLSGTPPWICPSGGRLSATSSYSREFQWLAQRTHPSEFFFNQSALCLYLSLNNPTASEFINYDESTRPDQVVAITEAFQRHQPRFIVLFPENTTSSDVRDNAAPFRRYVMTITTWPNLHLERQLSIRRRVLGTRSKIKQLDR